MKITDARFLTSAVSPKQYPPESLPEFAFMGRSNVGKSSLINSLLNRKKLVKTSATPGKTQTLNFFQVNDQMIFTDFPGYGFAKVPLEVKKHWRKMVEGYLLNRGTLVCVVVIVDIRREPTGLDLELQSWLEANRIDHVVVATKADKLSQSERSRQMRLLQSAFMERDRGDVLPYSSKTNVGRKELWRALLNKAEGRGVPLSETGSR